MDNLAKCVWLGLFVLPAVAWFAFALLKRNARLSNAVLTGCLVLVVVTLLAMVMKLSFRSTAANIYWWLATYLAYAFAAISALRFKSGVVRVLAAIAANLPILGGYFMATIGALGLLFIMGDATRPPMAVETVRPGIGCEMQRQDGGALGYGGYNVRLYAYWGPALKREIDAIYVDHAPSAHNPIPNAICADVVSKHSHKG